MLARTFVQDNIWTFPDERIHELREVIQEFNRVFNETLGPRTLFDRGIRGGALRRLKPPRIYLKQRNFQRHAM